MPARKTKPQMHPNISGSETFFAAIAAWRDWYKTIGMCTSLCHYYSRREFQMNSSFYSFFIHTLASARVISGFLVSA